MPEKARKVIDKDGSRQQLCLMSDSTIENRVYLFKDLAAAWLAANPGGFGSDATAAMAEIARISAVVADGEELDADELAKAIRGA